ncbi:MAG: type II secretion system F family protein [Bdellovibrionaceae bacterium]|nr:type II secretion system F family protein [Pseudobdellovibrionaceae bacterium]
MSLESLFSSPWIALPAFAVCVTVIFYFVFPRVFNTLARKSLGSREEVARLLDLMFVEVDQKKLTIMMLLVSFGLGIIFFLVLWPHVVIGIPVGVVVTFAMWSLPLMYVRKQWEKRCAKFVDQMVDGLTIMANGVKAGLSVTQSMERIVESLPNPISQEFNLVLSQIRLGRSVEEALIDLGERIPKPDVQMFVTAINILKETGGNMAETFSTIVTVIRERQKVERKIEAMTAQGIMQGLIISMVPIGIIVLLYFVDPGFIMPMFTTTLGLFLLVIMFALVIAGGVTVRKIVTIKV